jgi:lysophospholipase L1-like esterase
VTAVNRAALRPTSRRAHRTGLWLLSLALCLAGCSRARDPGEAVAAAAGSGTTARDVAADARQLRMLALGDSYTIGEGVPEAERWPEQLVAALAERGIALGPPQIIARTGWTTANLASAIAASELAPPYDLVTLLIGVNDQFQSFQEPEYPARFRALLERAIELAGGRRERTLVVSIPDYSVTPFAERFDPPRIRSALERYNEINRRIAAELGVSHIDITPASRAAAQDPALLASDRLHPSAVMYRGWVEQILPLAERALQPTSR